MNLNEYDKNIIDRCAYTSVDIKNFFDDELYLGLVDTVDEISSEWLRDLAVNLLLGELTNIGIFINKSITDIVNSEELVTLCCYLRSKFDKEYLVNLCLTLNINDISVISDIATNTDSNSEIIISIVDCIHNLKPLDEGWEFINTRNDIIYSDLTLAKHILSICDTAYKDQHDPIIVEPEDCNLISKYLNYLHEHIFNYKSVVENFITIDKSNPEYGLNLDDEILRASIKKHDIDLTFADSIMPMAVYYNSIISNSPITMPKVRFLHLRTTRHHFEYYIDHDEDPSVTEQVMLIANVTFKDISKETLVNRILRHTDEFKNKEIQVSMLKLIDIYFKHNTR